MDISIYKQLCSFYSIEPYCLDAKGRKQPLSPETQKEFLAAFGIDCDEKNIGRLLVDFERQQWQRIVTPCLVIPEKTDPLCFHLKLPEAALHNPLSWLVCEENSNRHEGICHPGEWIVVAEHDSHGEKYVAVKMQFSIDLPCGYHTISFRVETQNNRELNEDCTLIITPATCYTPPGLQQNSRIWGVACQLQTLRSKRNWGIGDFSDLRNLLWWSSQHGAGTVHINPLQTVSLPTSKPSYPDHFSSLSFINPLYLDPEDIADFHESEEAEKFSQHHTLKVHLASLHDQKYIDFIEVSIVKRAVFEILWQHFQENHLNPDTDRGLDFRRFQQSGGEDLKAFALYEILREHFTDKASENWTEWPEEYRHPHTAAVSKFADMHSDRIGYHQYLQWQSELQLASIGRRSMELGLKVGLLQTLPGNINRDSFETWYRPGLYAINMNKGGFYNVRNEITPIDSPPLIAQKLVESAYAPFIDALRANMQHAGALCIPYTVIAEHQCWLPRADSSNDAIYFKNPTSDILGILSLESQRNRCLVICEHAENLPEIFRKTLLLMSVLLYRPGHFATDPNGDWLHPEQYLSQLTVAASNSRLTCLNGFWLGKDIDILSTMYPSQEISWREKQIITRAGDRAHLLIALHRQNLLPEGYDLDPSTVSWLSPDLVRAVHLFLAKTPAKIFLLPMQDLPTFQEQDFFDEKSLTLPGWIRKLPMDLEAIQNDERLPAMFRAFCLERGMGVVRPSALLTDRRESKTAQIPRAFYRLQLNSNFTFSQAAEVVPYLSKLGISHCYTSPFLAARPGSTHGYDIIDHSSLNPEIGSRQEFEGFVTALDQHSMAQIIDMVPNHMGVGSDNKWWMDVLENGKASQYADFFDINWEPLQQELKGRVLLPVLGDHYGSALEGGQLRLDFSREKGAFSITYFEHCFPVAPRTYPVILEHDLQRLEGILGAQHDGFLELQNLLSSFRNLPDRQETRPEQLEMRQRNKEVLKRLLARLCRETPEIGTFIQENIIVFNGEKSRSKSYDLLHKLLAMQAYRLAYWRVASDEINYRRFFDINDLASIRMENQRVFEETHRLVLDLIATGRVDGLRIDHPDGLYNPKLYCCRLQEAVSDEAAAAEKLFAKRGAPDTQTLPLYVIVEKILADFEHLPSDWPVHGTTGYDFAVMVNGLFVDQTAKKDLTRIYHSFIDHSINFDDLLYRCKKLIVKTSMAGELNVLASMLTRLAKMNRYTQDFTLNSLRDALIEIVAYFPVYRTYITSDSISKHNRNYIEWAIAKAKAGQRAEDITIYDFLKSVLLLKVGPGKNETLRNAEREFVMKLQQYTGPIMAKGLEDTSFYIYNRLLSLNEVGGNPCHFGTSTASFHHENSEKSNHYPHGMLNTSSHDSKRSEDVRARINVLSEMVPEWQEALDSWSACNKDQRIKLPNGYAPSRNDEYALYQNLIGVWPFDSMDEKGLAFLTDRIEGYMLKVIREAKVHTSWINQDPAYEAAIADFARGILAEKSPFLKEFVPFQKKIAWFGMFNSLAQLLLKLTSPGIPDIYQGSELWDFCLVDPDNRRPVDFHQREMMLTHLQESTSAPAGELASYVRQLLENMTDGRIKLYTVWKTLNCRRTYCGLFERGTYIPLVAKGEKEKHICAFMRHLGEQRLIVAAPLLTAGLLNKDDTKLPLGSLVWSNTVITLPDNLPEQVYENIFTGEEIHTGGPDAHCVNAVQLFNNFPVCLLLQTSEKGGDHE